MEIRLPSDVSVMAEWLSNQLASWKRVGNRRDARSGSGSGVPNAIGKRVARLAMFARTTGSSDVSRTQLRPTCWTAALGRSASGRASAALLGSGGVVSPADTPPPVTWRDMRDRSAWPGGVSSRVNRSGSALGANGVRNWVNRGGRGSGWGVAHNLCVRQQLFDRSPGVGRFATSSVSTECLGSCRGGGATGSRPLSAGTSGGPSGTSGSPVL
jgi:hypothetical protein